MHAAMNVEHTPYEKCPNAALGCQAKFPQNELLTHLESCFFEKFRQQQRDLAVLKKAFTELFFKYTATQEHPQQRLIGVLSGPVTGIIQVDASVLCCSEDGVLVEITHDKGILGTKTAPVRKLYEHNGVLYTIHSDKVTAWRHAKTFGVATISDTDVKPFFQGPFANSIPPLCLLVKGNRMFIGAGSMVIINDIEKNEVISCKQLLSQNSQISYLSLVVDAKNNMLSLITAESDGIIKFWNSNLMLTEAIKAHARALTSMVLIPYGETQLLVSSSLDGYVRLWDIVSRNMVLEIPCISDVLAMKCRYTNNELIIATGHADGTARVFTVTRKSRLTFHTLHTIAAHDGGVSAIELNADGTLLTGGRRDFRVSAWKIVE